jgi:hypothetical protein
VYKVRFTWFEKDFDTNSNFFIDALKNRIDKIEIITSPSAECDLEIISCHRPFNQKVFGKFNRFIENNPVASTNLSLFYPTVYDLRTKHSKRRIWYTAENLRPPIDHKFDGTLSFDQDTYSGVNHYMPSWYQYAGFFGESFISRVGKYSNSEILLNPRSLSKKKKFACAFVRNPDPVRLRLIEKLRKFGEVDLFGPQFNSNIPEKYEVAKNYRYQVCLENDLYPGYVTEKLIDSFLCDNVPIYWGDFGKDASINKSGIINLKDFDSMDDLVRRISTINDDEYENLYSNSYLNFLPDLNPITQLLLGIE